MKKRIGDILIEMGFIDTDELNMALAETKRTGAMLGDVLTRLDWITEEQFQMAIAVQSGAKILELDGIAVDQGLIARVPHKFVVKHGIFPISVENDILKAATTNPFDVVARDELSRLTGNRVEAYIAPKEWISGAIKLHYKTALSIDNDIETIIGAGMSAWGTDENQIVQLADLIVDKGHVLGASDIHVVPDIHLVRIYYRIDGVLHQNYLFPIAFHQSLVSRFKIIADIDISNPNVPHDGRIKYKGSSGVFDLRVSTFPTHLGETVVMRLLTYNKVIGDLKRLGFEDRDLDVFNRNIHRPYGLVLVTGPTGSGKTTTLYSALMEINGPTVNTMTIEDPIEFVLPTIRQTAINPKAGMSFSNALRSAMRQDPDIILVGEIRDRETADLALRAAMTGHLVMSTLHTNNAASVIDRLLDLGINASILASSLSMVAAQRLVRKVCAHCATKEKTTAVQTEIFRANGLDAPGVIFKANGCVNCMNSGYKGRTAIFEVIEVTREIEELIYQRALHTHIEKVAIKDGTILMLRQGLRKVAAGITTFEEIFRVIDYA